MQIYGVGFEENKQHQILLLSLLYIALGAISGLSVFLSVSGTVMGILLLQSFNYYHSVNIINVYIVIMHIINVVL